ncbi:MAG: sigma-54 interaction domain-containing protein [Terriglobales bacterium]
MTSACPSLLDINVARRTHVEEVAPGVGFVAASPVMLQLRQQIDQMAPINLPVLVLGESGVGKEVAARLLHQLSPRRSAGFLKVNCAAVPHELLESELFGYEAGAFTGAVRAKPGKFEMCPRGTILLDELGELPPSLQSKLLQVLEDRTFSRLGGRSLVTLDARVIAATNVNIDRAIVDQLFRADLYYRLGALQLRIPPLRERREDIVPQLRYFMDRLSAGLNRPALPLSDELLAACQAHSWPGNVRELQNFIKRFLVHGDPAAALAELTPRCLACAPQAESWSRGRPQDLKGMVREVKARVEREAIQEVLASCRWHRGRTAELLGISTKALGQKIRQYGIELPWERADGDGAQPAAPVVQ